jgi:4,5-DOPA dioxygenase extradiol
LIPALFVSHGAPTLATDPGKAGAAFSELGRTLPRPRSILVISAHWDTPAPQVSAAPKPQTIHDFGGFPEELYQIEYPAPGAPQLAERVAALLNDRGIAIHPNRGLDHGAWVPLLFLYPDADIPVTQLSLQSRLGPEHAHQIGAHLVPLRNEEVLILASGGIVHNLFQLDWKGNDAAPAPWAVEFADWMAIHIAANDTAALLDYRNRAPHAARAHPSEEHLVPLYCALGAGGAPAQRIPLGFTFGSLGMDAYLFGATD